MIQTYLAYLLKDHRHFHYILHNNYKLTRTIVNYPLKINIIFLPYLFP